MLPKVIFPTPMIHLPSLRLPGFLPLTVLSLLALTLSACQSPEPEASTQLRAEEVQAAQAGDGSDTYDRETIVGEATNYLGAGAEEVAIAIEKLFKDYGEPNAYIAGSEVGGGLVVGLRYGGGTLAHKIEGAYPIHWTGPSVGLDAGADAVKTFALVYDLHDTEELYRRIPALEGGFYYVAGLGVSVYQGKHVTVATVRFGGGLRAQATVGYIKFTKKRTFNPF